MKNRNYMAIGMDEQGQIYGVPVNEDGSLALNPTGGKTSCNVIRPVSEETLKYLRNDPESLLDVWKSAVEADITRSGLAEFFHEALAENGDPEWYPAKDDGFVDDLIASAGVEEPGKVLFQRAVMDAEEQIGEVVGTWECSGWFPPSTRFVVTYAPRELVEAYYAHLGI